MSRIYSSIIYNTLLDLDIYNLFYNHYYRNLEKRRLSASIDSSSLYDNTQ